VIQEGSSPSGARMRSAVSKGGDNSSPAGREEGMEKPKRAQRRKSDTAKADLKPSLAVPGGQGVRREAESEGHAEKYRAVIEGRHPEDELVGRGWGKVEPAIWRRRHSHSPTRNMVIAGGTVRKNDV
jgi:hypothetical protein